ncbi:hypothetical protein K8I61_00305 [bacterium]|nr:hypothetical protein [bacterium]
MHVPMKTNAKNGTSKKLLKVLVVIFVAPPAAFVTALIIESALYGGVSQPHLGQKDFRINQTRVAITEKFGEAATTIQGAGACIDAARRITGRALSSKSAEYCLVYPRFLGEHSGRRCFLAFNAEDRLLEAVCGDRHEKRPGF